MLIAMTAFIAAMGAGWQPIGGQLLASGVMLLCGHQDIRLGTRMGAGFWFFMALAFGISALVTATGAKIWWVSAICVGRVEGAVHRVAEEVKGFCTEKREERRRYIGERGTTYLRDGEGAEKTVGSVD